MGMFDNVICNAKLPGTPPAFIKPGHLFQTKDLECVLAIYTIEGHGTLTRKRQYSPIGEELPDETVEVVPYHGTLEFYTSNTTGVGHGAYFTRDGEDSESVDYLATFTNGMLAKIEETRREKRPALPSFKMRLWTKPSQEEIETAKTRQVESLLGRTMYMQWGFGIVERGYEVKIVYENKLQLVCEDGEGKLELTDRRSRDHTLFDSKQAAETDLERRNKENEARQREYEEMIAKRNSEEKMRSPVLPILRPSPESERSDH